MSSGLLALLDDVAGIAKMAAASLDDMATQATRAGVKAAGVIVDDAAVAPRYVAGFAASRELPVVWRITLGSLRNKLVFLLPAALLLSAFAPWAITPLLVAGGAYLCLEGAEKAAEAMLPHHAPTHGATMAGDPRAVEDAKVAGAIRTDLILSAEIMAITLAAVAEASMAMQAVVLAVVGVALTIVVYGAVALIVKADDAGLVLARSGSALLRWLGRGIVAGMPGFMRLLGTVGTAAMLWVGGGIVLHGLARLGLDAPALVMEHASEMAAHAAPWAPAAVGWIAGALVSGLFGLALGAALLLPVAWLRRRRG